VLRDPLCLVVGPRRGWPSHPTLGAALYTAWMSSGLAKLVDATVGLRIDDAGEEQDLDLHQHGESGYNS
jgi:ammonia channel protein AmtB